MRSATRASPRPSGADGVTLFLLCASLHPRASAFLFRRGEEEHRGAEEERGAETDGAVGTEAS
jgi:hypothetical protein